MNLSFFLSWRFLFSRHRSGFARLLTYLSIGSVGLALSAFVIVMSVMNGFDRDLSSRIIAGIGAVRGFSASGDIAYTPALDALIKEIPGVTSATPELQVSAILRGRRPPGSPLETAEAHLTGVDIDQKIKTSPLKKQLLGAGRLPMENEILLAAPLAERLGVDVSDTVEAVLFFSSPVRSSYRVSGLFRTGYYEVDASSAILQIEPLRRAFSLTDHQSHVMEIGVSSVEDAQSVADQLNARFTKEGLYFRSWREMREPLFRAVRLEKLVMAVILSLFGLIAVFSVLSALTATAVEKRRELAVLRAMGMTRGGVARVLLTAGMIAGGLGVLLGGVLSLAGHLLITRSAFFKLPPDIYDLDRLPSEWSMPVLAVTAFILFSLSILSALVPACIQARKAPSEALREE